MRILSIMLLACLLFPVAGSAADNNLHQSPLRTHVPQKTYPKIVLFSTSWCPHCKAAKEYFTRNNIPFINRDVELDAEAMQLVLGKYKSQGVPVIVIGNDEKVLKGFDQTRVEKAIEEMRKKK